jgi:hypothetical protein
MQLDLIDVPKIPGREGSITHTKDQQAMLAANKQNVCTNSDAAESKSAKCIYPW